MCCCSRKRVDGKASASSAAEPRSSPAFPVPPPPPPIAPPPLLHPPKSSRSIHASTLDLLRRPCQGPGVTESVLEVVSPVSVYCKRGEEIASWICNVCVSVAVRAIVKAEASLRHAWHVAGAFTDSGLTCLRSLGSSQCCTEETTAKLVYFHSLVPITAVTMQFLLPTGQKK